MKAADVDRFLRYVEKSDGCWRWTGARMPRGYGRFYFSGKPRYAHRVALTLLAGQHVADDAVVMHTCDNPACVNPAHLRVATQTENMRDAAAKGRTVNPTDWRATSNPKAKLTLEQVSAIRARLDAGERPVDLAREFGVTRARVSQLRRGGFE